MFLPVTREDMAERGWEQVDFVLVTGDGYVDHHSFGTAIIGRLLESRGYRVAVLAQPDFKSAAGTFYWYIHGNQHHGVPVVWSKGQRKLIEDHREHDHSYRGVLADHYGPRFSDDPAAFKDAEHADQHY